MISDYSIFRVYLAAEGVMLMLVALLAAMLVSLLVSLLVALMLVALLVALHDSHWGD